MTDGGSTAKRARRGRRGPVEEDAYRTRRYHGSVYFTSRQEHQELTVVVKRFPSAPGVVDAESPIFVLVHGLGVSSRYFQPLALELAKTGRVFVVDLPGYGAAPNPRRDVTLADHAAVLAGLLEKIAERFPDAAKPVIIGHSMGSNIVAKLATEHPEVAEKIVLMAPTMQTDRRGFWRATRSLLTDALHEPPVVVGIAFTDYLIRCGLPYLLRQTPHLLGDRPEERMPRLSSEVLVVCGDRDRIVGEQWGQQLVELGSTTRYATVHGPHVIMHTDPGSVARHITDFVAGRPAGAGATDAGAA